MIKSQSLFFFNKKIFKNIVIILFLVSLIIIPVSNLNKVNAITSSVTSGLHISTGVDDTNQQNFVFCAGYDILLVNNTLLFYDSNGILAKQYTITDSYSYMAFYRVAVYNSTYICITETHEIYPTANQVTGWFMLLNVNTLANTVYNFNPIDVSDYVSQLGYPIGLAMYVNNGYVFAIAVGTYAGTYGLGVWQLLTNGTVLTVASIQKASSSDTRIPLGGCWIVVNSPNTNSFYLIGETYMTSHIFMIDEICYTVGSSSIVLIGINGGVGGYSGGYVYFINSIYITDSVGNSYTEILIYYPANTNNEFVLNLIKFNATFLDVNHLTVITGVNVFTYPRLVGYDSVLTGNGLDGVYNLYYIGLNYSFMQLPVSLSNSVNGVPTFSLTGGLISSYYQVWQTELFYFQTNNIGGFWDINTGILVEIDYSSQNNALACATKFLSVAHGGNTGVGSGGSNGNNGGGSWNGSNGGSPVPTAINYNGSGGVNTVVPILTSIFGNVVIDIIFVIYGVICSLLTWKFAMTGLIAGIGISTFLCTMAGILPIWAVGLCVILDITLIVLGSGLLNKNTTNANVK